MILKYGAQSLEFRMTSTGVMDLWVHASGPIQVVLTHYLSTGEWKGSLYLNDAVLTKVRGDKMSLVFEAVMEWTRKSVLTLGSFLEAMVDIPGFGREADEGESAKG